MEWLQNDILREQEELDYTALIKYLFLKDTQRLKGEMDLADHGVDGLCIELKGNIVSSYFC